MVAPLVFPRASEPVSKKGRGGGLKKRDFAFSQSPQSRFFIFILIFKPAKELGYEVTTLDLADSDINCDILDWDYTIYPPKHWDVIFASPPCNTFSCANPKRRNVWSYTNDY